MRLDRDGIVRKDFKHSLRGYDEWEVETHLKQVNQAVSVLIDEVLQGKRDLPPEVQERLEARVTLARLEAAELLDEARKQAESEKEEVNRLILKTLEEAAEEVDRLLGEARTAAEHLLAQARADSEAIRQRTTGG